MVELGCGGLSRPFMFEIAIALAIVATDLCSVHAAAPSNDNVQRFRNRYPDQFRRLEETYSHLQMTTVERRPDLDGNWTNVATAVFMGRGESLRREQINAVTGSHTVRVVTPRLSFFLEARDGGTSAPRYQLTELLHEATDDQYESIRIYTRLAHAPYCLFEQRIADVLQAPTFVVRYAREVEIDGQELVEIAWDCDFGSSTGGLHRIGEWWFMPEQAWAVKQSAVGVAGKDGRMWSVFSYDGEMNGVPLIRKGEYWTDYGDGVRKNESRIEVVDLKLEPAPAVAFRLSAFGIPDSVGELEDPSNRRFWLVIVGIGGLVVVFWLTRRARARLTT